MSYAPGFGLPDLTSPTSELRKAVADLEACPSNLLRDGQLEILRGLLEIREELEKDGPLIGAFRPPPT